MNIKIDGLDIFYTDEGEGQTVLMLHGWGSSCVAYKGIINTIKSKYRCIAMDFPGCGESSVMESPWTLDNYTDLVEKFCKAVNIVPDIIFGHSHGGRVAMKLAADKILEPKKLVLLDAAGLIPKKSFKQKARARSFKIIKGVLTVPLWKKGAEGLLNKARAHYGSADYNSAPPVLRQTLVSLVNTDIRESLPQISASTLLIWGENDTATPLADAKIIESLISDCGLCVIKNTGHWSFIENPALAHAIIKNFLGV